MEELAFFAVIWIGLFVLFLIFEFYALFTRKDITGDGRPDRNGGTLSEFVWKLLYKEDGTPRRLAISGLVGFMTWLVWHFAAGPTAKQRLPIIAGGLAGVLSGMLFLIFV